MKPTMSFPFELDPIERYYLNLINEERSTDMEHGPERRTFSPRRALQPNLYSPNDRRQSNTRRFNSVDRDRRIGADRRDHQEPEVLERRGDNVGRRVEFKAIGVGRTDYGRRFDDERSLSEYIYSDIV